MITIVEYCVVMSQSGVGVRCRNHLHKRVIRLCTNRISEWHYVCSAILLVDGTHLSVTSCFDCQQNTRASLALLSIGDTELAVHYLLSVSESLSRNA